MAISFLSCLRGSELHHFTLSIFNIFLSCLRGSEHDELFAFTGGLFLSCLRGSERRVDHAYH